MITPDGAACDNCRGPVLATKAPRFDGGLYCEACEKRMAQPEGGEMQDRCRTCGQEWEVGAHEMPEGQCPVCRSDGAMGVLTRQRDVLAKVVRGIRGGPLERYGAVTPERMVQWIREVREEAETALREAGIEQGPKGGEG
ncbi:MAG: hypothetical protein JXP34_26755 [Planctomycetes bacterium]|nr:hypothetical protein [Planctomycetota bacterium]